jgi:hypothetical protein
MTAVPIPAEQYVLEDEMIGINHLLALSSAKGLFFWVTTNRKGRKERKVLWFFSALFANSAVKPKEA